MNRRPFLGCLLMLPVATCATVDPTYVERVVVERPHVAPSLLHCKAEPDPLPPGAKQRDVAPYTLALAAAGRDCRRKLGTVAERLEGGSP